MMFSETCYQNCKERNGRSIFCFNTWKSAVLIKAACNHWFYNRSKPKKARLGRRACVIFWLLDFQQAHGAALAAGFGGGHGDDDRGTAVRAAQVIPRREQFLDRYPIELHPNLIALQQLGCIRLQHSRFQFPIFGFNIQPFPLLRLFRKNLAEDDEW
jgi:hypothetical protein